ncbi:MAG: RNA polymerase sigma factor [Spirochaetes bacterium]|nr:RNA polymerase sigma factor [Spirochaetota bacterium]
MDKEKLKQKAADFFSTEHKKLIWYVRGLIDDTSERDSEDIVQDVFLNIFDIADVSAPIENLAAYVYRSIRNRVIDILKKKKKETVSLDEIECYGDFYLNNCGSYSDAVSTEVVNNEMKEALYSAIDSLGEEYREIIILTEFEGKSFREISDTMRIPLGTLLSRKSRAMKILQTKLENIKEN